MKTGIGMTLLIIGLFALAIFCAYQEDKEWQEYAASRHCHAVGKKEAQLGTGFSSSGKAVITTTPEQTIYSCDEGEIRIR